MKHDVCPRCLSYWDKLNAHNEYVECSAKCGMEYYIDFNVPGHPQDIILYSGPYAIYWMGLICLLNCNDFMLELPGDTSFTITENEIKMCAVFR